MHLRTYHSLLLLFKEGTLCDGLGYGSIWVSYMNENLKAW